MKELIWSRRKLLSVAAHSTVLASALPGTGKTAPRIYSKEPHSMGNHNASWVLPNDKRWPGLNQDITANPYAIALCESESDIFDSLNYALLNQLPFRIRNGGHSYMGFSLLDQGLIIDLSLMKSIHISGSNRVRIACGCTLGEIYTALFKQSASSIPGGTCETVGISGLTLGGGIGFLSRLHGLTSDTLASLEIIVPNRDQFGFHKVRASPSENPDLFWACRGGGGGNFGLVTAFEFETQPIPAGKSLFAEINTPWQQDDKKDSYQIHSLGKAWMNAVNAFNRKARTDHRYRHFFSVIAFFSRNNGSGMRILAWSFHNDPDVASNLYDEFLSYFEIDSFPLAEESKQLLPYIDVVRKLGDSGPLRSFYCNSGFCNSVINDNGLSTISRLVLSKEYNTNGCETLLQMDSLGGRISEFGASHTAWPHRSAQFSLQFRSYWTDESHKADCKRWIDDFINQLNPHLTGLCYCNYPCPSNNGHVKRYYGDHWQRLIDIKRKWDPNNLFTVTQGIPVAG